MSKGLRPGERVCVTGASGFIGAHLVRHLVAAGHKVRATVRDPEDPTKTAPLRGLEGDVEIVRADLFEPDTIRAAVDACPFVCHVAASTRLSAKDPQREIVDVAVEGTRNVLDAVDDAGCERVVLTSSVAAVLDRGRPPGHTFTEDDWNESATLAESPYGVAKTRSERLAWERAEGASWSLVAINPTAVFGPLLTAAHARSSPSFLTSLLGGEIPAVPRVHINVCDMAEVVQAHRRALEDGSLTGRFIINSGPTSLPEIARRLAREFPDRKVPTRVMPNALMRLIGRFDKRVSRSLLDDLGKTSDISNRRSVELMGLDYGDVLDSAARCGRSILAVGAA